MADIKWQCPWCGASFGVDQARWRAGGSIRCPECSVSVDLAPDPPAEHGGFRPGPKNPRSLPAHRRPPVER